MQIQKIWIPIPRKVIGYSRGEGGGGGGEEAGRWRGEEEGEGQMKSQTFKKKV